MQNGENLSQIHKGTKLSSKKGKFSYSSWLRLGHSGGAEEGVQSISWFYLFK